PPNRTRVTRQYRCVFAQGWRPVCRFFTVVVANCCALRPRHRAQTPPPLWENRDLRGTGPAACPLLCGLMILFDPRPMFSISPNVSEGFDRLQQLLLDLRVGDEL